MSATLRRLGLLPPLVIEDHPGFALTPDGLDVGERFASAGNVDARPRLTTFDVDFSLVLETESPSLPETFAQNRSREMLLHPAVRDVVWAVKER